MIKLPVFDVLDEMPSDLTWPIARVVLYCVGLALAQLALFTISV